MKNFFDLQAIDFTLLVVMDLVPVIENGVAFVTADLCNRRVFAGNLAEPITVSHEISIVDAFDIAVTMSNKQYDPNRETAVKIEKLTVDGIDLLPPYLHHCEYHDEQGNPHVTSYLGWNGTWRLRDIRPFYAWLHQAQGQGWLLDFKA